ncbi:MAG: phosphate ABC transporter substrate-binding protein [Candidatus Omnitrophica bacterium]|nr:phosphate ABC transporter substrate-binding protein [Candidatus Omnitrophota bacterium]
MSKFGKLLLACFLVSCAVTSAYAGGPFGVDKRRVIIEGSTTVLPIAQAAAETFMRQNQETDVTVRGGGSGVGIASLIDKNCDIADSSRSIKEAEIEKAVGNGVSPKAHVVAMDGICLIVNSSNPISALSRKQASDIFTGKISYWSDLGGKTERIVAISRDTSSGTFEAFGILVLEGQKVRPDALMQASNQAVASTVSRTPGAIGYVGLGYLTPEVKALDIDGIKPSKETVLSGQYPVGRPLFMYTNGVPDGVVRDFIDFIKSDEGQKIANEQGFVALK